MTRRMVAPQPTPWRFCMKCGATLIREHTAVREVGPEERKFEPYKKPIDRPYCVYWKVHLEEEGAR